MRKRRKKLPVAAYAALAGAIERSEIAPGVAVPSTRDGDEAARPEGKRKK